MALYNILRSDNIRFRFSVCTSTLALPSVCQSCMPAILVQQELLHTFKVAVCLRFQHVHFIQIHNIEHFQQ